MPALIIISASILTFVFWIQKRRLKRKGGKRLAYHFFDKSLEFLVPFTIVGVVFLLISLSISNVTDQTTVGRLLFLERLIGAFRGFVSVFKIGVLPTIGLLIVFYLLSLTRIPSKYTSRLLPYFKKYRKVLKWCYLVTMILWSFTFFGTQAGEPVARLRFRITEAEGKYASLHQEVQATLWQETQKKIIEKIKATADPEYRKGFDEQDKYFVTFIQLRSSYQDFKASNPDPRVEYIVNHPPPKDPPPPRPSNSNGTGPKPPGAGSGPSGEAEMFETDSRRGLVYEVFEAAPPTKPAVKTDTDVSASQIDEAVKSVRNYRTSFKSGLANVLKSDSGQEIVFVLPRTFSSKLKNFVAQSLIERYPIFEPLLDSMLGVSTAAMESRIAAATEKMASSLAKDPSTATQTIQTEAGRIADETVIPYSENLMRKGRAVSARLESRGQLLRNAQAKLDDRRRELEEAAREAEQVAAASEEIENQIELLSCRNEDLRLNAAKELEKAGPNLTSGQVTKIEALLNSNEVRLRPSKTFSDRYEPVPVRYYAAKALANNPSEYVSEGIRDVARQIETTVDQWVFPRARTVARAEVEGLGLAAP